MSSPCPCNHGLGQGTISVLSHFASHAVPHIYSHAHDVMSVNRCRLHARHLPATRPSTADGVTINQNPACGEEQDVWARRSGEEQDAECCHRQEAVYCGCCLARSVLYRKPSYLTLATCWVEAIEACPGPFALMEAQETGRQPSSTAVLPSSCRVAPEMVAPAGT